MGGLVEVSAAESLHEGNVSVLEKAVVSCGPGGLLAVNQGHHFIGKRGGLKGQERVLGQNQSCQKGENTFCNE